MRLIHKSEYKSMPWKNGLGQTQEIDRSPLEGAYRWRLSQAPVLNDGPFSRFPGCDRWICVVDGEGIFLNDQKVEKLQPIRFSGDTVTNCRLAGGPIVDLGLIFNPHEVDAEMKVVQGSIQLPEFTAGGVHYVFDLKSGDTRKFDRTEHVQIEKGILVSVWEL